MRECYRPYTKLIDMKDGAPVTVDFHDTSGNLIKCNYVAVTSVSGGAAENFFSVTPSGLNNVSVLPTDINNNASSLPGIASTSGMAGLVANCAGGSVVFSLNLYDTISHIIISQSADDSTGFAVTYGIVNVANPRGDDALENLNLGTL